MLFASTKKGVSSSGTIESGVERKLMNNYDNDLAHNAMDFTKQF